MGVSDLGVQSTRRHYLGCQSIGMSQPNFRAVLLLLQYVHVTMEGVLGSTRRRCILHFMGTDLITKCDDEEACGYTPYTPTHLGVICCRVL